MYHLAHLKHSSLASYAEMNISEWQLPSGVLLERRYEGDSAWELSQMEAGWSVFALLVLSSIVFHKLGSNTANPASIENRIKSDTIHQKHPWL